MRQSIVNCELTLFSHNICLIQALNSDFKQCNFDQAFKPRDFQANGQDYLRKLMINQ